MTTIDSILAAVDMPAADPNAPAPLTAAEKRSAEAASKKAYFEARAKDASVTEATDAAEKAYHAEVSRMRALEVERPALAAASEREQDDLDATEGRRQAETAALSSMPRVAMTPVRAALAEAAVEKALLCFDCGSEIAAGQERREVDPEEGFEVSKCSRCAYIMPGAPERIVTQSVTVHEPEPKSGARLEVHTTPEGAAAIVDAVSRGALLGVGVLRVEEAQAYAAQAPVAEGTLDAIGEARSTADRDAARASGWSPAETVYRRGFRVVDLGVENARASRLEHDAKPTIAEACDELIAKIASEKRSMTSTLAHQVGMDPVTGHVRADGLSLPITEPAFASLVSRLGYGGAGYLSRCPIDLRAENVNRWSGLLLASHNQAVIDHHAKVATAPFGKVKALGPAPEPRELKLRTRSTSTGSREVFAAVTPSYTPFDADKIAAAVKLATPPDARAAVTYDGYRAQIDIVFHSNVQPQHFVAGEFFKAGVRLRTADDGSGSVRGSATVFQNLCLNLIIIDALIRDLFRVRHIGSVDALAAAFRAGFAKALASLDHFLRAWGYACEDDLVARAKVIDAETPSNPREALPGLFRGLIAEKRVTLPGREIEAHVAGLVRMWEADDSGAKLVHEVSRASIVNALTRYAHAELPNFEDPFATDDLEREASALLWGRGKQAPAPLVWMPASSAAASA